MSLMPVFMCRLSVLVCLQTCSPKQHKEVHDYHIHCTCVCVCNFGGISRGLMRLISEPYEKAALVLMHNKVNGLLLYHNVQTTPVGTSAPHCFVCCVCVCVLQPYLKRLRKRWQKQTWRWQNANVPVCVHEREKGQNEGDLLGLLYVCICVRDHEQLFKKI